MNLIGRILQLEYYELDSMNSHHILDTILKRLTKQLPAIASGSSTDKCFKYLYYRHFDDSAYNLVYFKTGRGFSNLKQTRMPLFLLNSLLTAYVNKEIVKSESLVTRVTFIINKHI